MIILELGTKQYAIRSSQILELFLCGPILNNKHLNLWITTSLNSIEIKFNAGEDAEKAFSGILEVIKNGGTITITGGK